MIVEPAEAERPLNLPFHLDVILDDRRGSSTGLHAVVLLSEEEEAKRQVSTVDAQQEHPQSLTNVALIDIARGDDVPRYDSSTYLLFPSPGESVPIDEVAATINTLVVLDCKWTKSGLARSSQELSRLQKVRCK
jgi:hypothetical protein